MNAQQPAANQRQERTSNCVGSQGTCKFGSDCQMVEMEIVPTKPVSAGDNTKS